MPARQSQRLPADRPRQGEDLVRCVTRSGQPSVSPYRSTVRFRDSQSSRAPTSWFLGLRLQLGEKQPWVLP